MSFAACATVAAANCLAAASIEVSVPCYNCEHCGTKDQTPGRNCRNCGAPLVKGVKKSILPRKQDSKIEATKRHLRESESKQSEPYKSTELPTPPPLDVSIANPVFAPFWNPPSS